MEEELKENKPAKKETNILYPMIAVFMAMMMLVSVVLTSVIMINTQKTQEALLEALNKSEEENVTREDDVVIMDEYLIESTTHISDAYKTGDTSKLSDKDKEILDMASAVLSEIITDGMTEFEKEKAVYDWMTHNLQNDTGLLVVIPTSGADSDNPYGVLKYHDAVCVGYATTFRLFMQMMDIPCMVVHNTEEYHSWNLTKLDGEWYHTDIYSDAGSGTYANFNMNDSMCAQGHDWDTAFFPPANGIKYNMAYQNSTPSDSVYDIPATVRKAMENGDAIVALKYDKSLTEMDAQIGENMLNTIEWEYTDTEELGSFYMTHSWNPVDDGYLLAIYIINPEKFEPEDPEIEIDDETYEKINKAIEDAFGDLNSSGGDSPWWEFDIDGYEDDYYVDDVIYDVLPGYMPKG